MLVVLALIPFGIGVYLGIGRQRARVVAAGGLGLGRPEPVQSRRIRERIPGLLFVAAMVVFAVALARPQAVVSLGHSEGIVVLTVDVSGSMAADDLKPSRLDVAKGVARAFVDDRPDGVLVGIVAFDETGLSVQAPTDDGVALRRAIDRLAPTLGTSMGQGILAALDAINRVEGGTPPEYYSSRSPEPALAPEPSPPGSHSGAAIVLLTDGENTVPPEPDEATKVAADEGIRIDTVGVGTVSGTTLRTDGFSVYTQLNESPLRNMAELTKGEYFALDPDAEDITASVDPSDVYESLGQQMDVRSEPVEITSLLAGVGIALLLTGAGISLALSGRLL
jgi:Ca-activated chloride channel family protein